MIEKDIIRKFMIVALALLTVLNSCREGDYVLEEKGVVIRDNGAGTGTVTWTSDKEYLLDGFVYVNEGDVLTIEAGTVIRGRAGRGENASALIVARGGKIIANGTKEHPIIFTAEKDDLDGTIGFDERGLWGGLILLGNAPLNTPTGEAIIEGVPILEPRAVYGGEDETDNSGVLRYVSIRYGGTNIGEGNEINGLTLGGIGNKTTIEFVEVVSNEDDGMEIMGGTVNVSNVVVAFCGDDCFDIDLGWQGNGQFWTGIQSEGLGDYGVEITGNTDNPNRRPYTLPKLANLTLVGNGSASGRSVIDVRNSGGLLVINSIFVHANYGISLEYVGGEYDSFFQWQNGNVLVGNNLFSDIAQSGISDAFRLRGFPTDEATSEWENYFHAGGNAFGDAGLTYSGDHYQLMPNALAYASLHEALDPWFRVVGFKGSFGEISWTDSWSLLSQEGLIN